jgi:Transglycosylase
MATSYKVLLGSAVLVLIAAGALISRVFLHTSDLPDIEHLSEFAPASGNQVTDTCLHGIAFAVPFDRIGKRFREALESAEPPTSFADQIARTLMCAKLERSARYQLDVFRLSWHIRRRFSEEELFTIYANRAYFGPAATGIENASDHLFQKTADTLSIEEAALLAGVLRGPDMYSPFKYQNRAINRRNEVLKRMASQGKLSGTELARALATPAVTRSLGNTEANPLPSGVVKGLAPDTEIYCDEFDDAFKKGCEETFLVNLMWRELSVTPKGLRAVLIENRNLGFCGSAGCSLSLFIQQPDSQFIQCLGTDGDVGNLDEVKVLKTIMGGYYDIQKTWADGKTHTIYRWTGSEYSAD